MKKLFFAFALMLAIAAGVVVAQQGAPVSPQNLPLADRIAHTLPEKYRNRRIYQRNAKQTLVRTDVDENAQLGRIIAGKLNASRGPVAVYLPLKAISVISAPGGPYHWPEADAALFDSLKTNLRKDIPVHELDVEINDPIFARAMAEGLLAMGLEKPARGSQGHAPAAVRS